MALKIDNVEVIYEGETLTSVWIDLLFQITELTTPALVIAPSCYKSETDYLEGAEPIPIFEITTVPGYLNYLRMKLLPEEYAIVDILAGHTLLKDLLEQGDSHPDWDEHVHPDSLWPGLGIGAVDIVMPS